MFTSSIWLSIILAAFAPPPARILPIDPHQTASCRSEPPAISEVIRTADLVILARVSHVEMSASANTDDDRLTGVFVLTPVETLKGGRHHAPFQSRFDATLYPDSFGGPACRWSPMPVVDDIWIIAASRDGEDCADCDGRLDAAHKLTYLAPRTHFPQ